MTCGQPHSKPQEPVTNGTWKVTVRCSLHIQKAASGTGMEDRCTPPQMQSRVHGCGKLIISAGTEKIREFTQVRFVFPYLKIN